MDKKQVLVINADCVERNSSANLCHLAYINGLISAGYEVTLLSADSAGYETDSSMSIPKEVIQHTYNGMTLYEKLSIKKGASGTTASTGNESKTTDAPQKESVKSRIVTFAKSCFLGMYGPHGIYSKFPKTAKKFKSDVEYDYVLSLATPPSSHLLAYKLIKSGNVKTKKWIQIWEDPWYSDAYDHNGKNSIKKEEGRLLSFAERVCYVSPITLKNQQRIYPESADKMYWQPLPYYYKGDEGSISVDGYRYGYFGDYAPAARNLAPFYEAAVKAGIEVNICGNPSNLFKSDNKVIIHPRLNLSDLKVIEDKTNVLIFLCNRKGGQIPGKIYQYSATNKYILFILDGTEEEKKVIKDYFAKYNRYVFCENTVEDITRGINVIESGEMGEINNEPVEDFNPIETIRKILEGC